MEMLTKPSDKLPEENDGSASSVNDPVESTVSHWNEEILKLSAAASGIKSIDSKESGKADETFSRITRIANNLQHDLSRIGDAGLANSFSLVLTSTYEGMVNDFITKFGKAPGSTKVYRRENPIISRNSKAVFNDVDIKILDEISEAATSILALDEILGIIVRKMVKAADVDHATITFLSKDKTKFEIEHEYPVLLGDDRFRRSISISGRPFQESLLINKQPIAVQNLESHLITSESREFSDTVGKLNIKSMLIVPMILNGVVIGTISVDTVGRRKKFHGREISIYKQIANRIVYSVEREQFRARELEWSRGGSRQPSGGQNLKETVAMLLFELRSITEFARASIQTIDDSGHRTIVGASGFDPSIADPNLTRDVSEDSLVKMILNRKTIEIIPDTHNSPLWLAEAGTAEIRSWVGIPLLSEGKVISLVTLDHSSPGFFGKGISKVLQSFATSAARQIRQAYNFEISQRQSRSLELVGQIAKIINSTVRKTRLLLDSVSREITTQLGCNRCDIWRLKTSASGKPLLVHESSSGESPKTANILDLESALGYDRSPLLQALYKGSLLISDARRDYFPPEGKERRMAPRSMVVAPIRIGSQTIGIICASHGESDWFTEHDRLLLDAVSLHVGTAYQRNLGLKLLKDLSQKIIRARKPGEILQIIVQSALNTTHSKSGVIYLLDEAASRITDSFVIADARHPMPRLENPNGLTRSIINLKETVVITDIEHDKRVNPDLVGIYKSMVAVPLQVDKAIVGVLYLNDTATHEYSQAEISFLETLANLAASAIQGAKLHQKIEMSELRYSSLVENIPHFIFRKDRDSKFTFGNREFCEFLGTTQEEIVGKTDYDFFPKELADKFVTDDRLVFREKRPIEVIEPNEMASKVRNIYVQTIKRPIIENGIVTEIQGVFWDVTKEVSARRTLINQIPESIVLFKGDAVHMANDKAIRMLEFDRESELKYFFADYFRRNPRFLSDLKPHKHEVKPEIPQGIMDVVLKSGKPMRVEIYFLEALGEDEFLVKLKGSALGRFTREHLRHKPVSG